MIGKDGNPIHDFSFDKDSPWPILDDLDGHSIQILDPSGNHGDGTNWKASSSVGGNLEKTQSFEDWQTQYFTELENSNPAISGPKADPDQDGINNFSEYALGYSPKIFQSSILKPIIKINEDGESYLYVEFLVAPGNRDANIKVQSSEDLISWSDNVQEMDSSEIDPTGFEIKIFRFSEPLKNSPNSAFLRINVTE